MRRALILLALLAACSPTDFADKVGRRAAESVVLPVVSRYLPGPQAETATRCVIDNASAYEIQTLARDVAVEAGTRTVQTVATIMGRAETRDCLLRSGLPAIPG